jgi:glutathione peroxidase
MKTTFFLGLALALSLSACAQPAAPEERATESLSTPAPVDFYSFKVETLDGGTFDFATLRGKRVLIVNTASKCGFTPQYKELQELWGLVDTSKFVILGFPSNDFGQQEPGSNTDVASFCEKNYGVAFPMMTKVATKGSNQHPVYAWLTQKEQNGVSNAEVRWNFHKFLIDENGQWVESLLSTSSPLGGRIRSFAAGK